ncbi:MAG: hypothetical protein R3C03_12095 [Pirellulaceae bacterium]
MKLKNFSSPLGYGGRYSFTYMAKHRPQLVEYLGNKCVNCPKTVEEMVARFGDVHRIFKFPPRRA